jgi:hypothetical protein
MWLRAFSDKAESAALYAAVILRCEHAASKSAFTRIFDALWLHASLEGSRLLTAN